MSNATNTMKNSNRKIEYVLNSFKKVLQSFEVQGYDNVVFNATFYRNGKKLNSIGKSGTDNFSKLIRNYEKIENPDKVKIEFFNADTDTQLWNKEFSLTDTTVEPVQGTFQGFGEAEINDIVSRKISDYQKIKENEALKTQLEQLTAENEDLKGDLEEVTDQLNAKRQMEYYAGILGMAMPGLAKVLGKSQAGQTLGFLSGIEDEPQQIESPKPASDNKTAIIQLLDEYMQSLDNNTLGKLYLIMCDFSKTPQLIDKTLHYLKNNNQSHEQGSNSNDKKDGL